MNLNNIDAINYSYLQEMYEDSYFPNSLVDKGKEILLGLCAEIEAAQPKTLDELYLLTHQATDKFNDLQEEFYAQGSEIETAARECIAVDFENLARIYGFDADIEELTANRDW
ncbi:MAG: DUF5713 family protein [Thiolinea sp.]